MVLASQSQAPGRQHVRLLVQDAGVALERAILAGGFFLSGFSTRPNMKTGSFTGQIHSKSTSPTKYPPVI